MKIQCPVCKTAYSIPQERLAKGVKKAVCKGCGTKMMIDLDAGAVKAIQGSHSPSQQEGSGRRGTPEVPDTGDAGAGRPEKESPEPESVMAMSPEYPARRDALIIGVFIGVVVLLLAAGYLAFRQTEVSFRRLAQDPISYLARVVNGYETYKVSEAFLRRNEGMFRELGPDLRFSLLKEEIRMWRGEKRAKLLVKAQGRRGTRKVLFQLKKKRGRWRIFYVGVELPGGEYKTIYPQQRS